MVIDQVTAEDQDAIRVLLEQRADVLREEDIDFLQGIKLRRTVTAPQRKWLEDLWRRHGAGPVR